MAAMPTLSKTTSDLVNPQMFAPIVNAKTRDIINEIPAGKRYTMNMPILSEKINHTVNLTRIFQKNKVVLVFNTDIFQKSGSDSKRGEQIGYQKNKRS
jgi:hypothetical protein